MFASVNIWKSNKVSNVAYCEFEFGCKTDCTKCLLKDPFQIRNMSCGLDRPLSVWHATMLSLSFEREIKIAWNCPSGRKLCKQRTELRTSASCPLTLQDTHQKIPSMILPCMKKELGKVLAGGFEDG